MRDVNHQVIAVHSYRVAQGREHKQSGQANLWQRLLLCSLLLTLLLGSSGCVFGVTNNITFRPGYVPVSSAKIQVGQIHDITAKESDVDKAKMMSHAMQAELYQQSLLRLYNSSPQITIVLQIREYKKGNAFKRMIFPEYGKTVLDVSYALVADNQQVVASGSARSEVFAGAIFSVGAWETIFNDVARRIVKDIKKQFVKSL